VYGNPDGGTQLTTEQLAKHVFTFLSVSWPRVCLLNSV
jgi:hypothetical protein